MKIFRESESILFKVEIYNSDLPQKTTRYMDDDNMEFLETVALNKLKDIYGKDADLYVEDIELDTGTEIFMALITLHKELGMLD